MEHRPRWSPFLWLSPVNLPRDGTVVWNEISIFGRRKGPSLSIEVGELDAALHQTSAHGKNIFTCGAHAMQDHVNIGLSGKCHPANGMAFGHGQRPVHLIQFSRWMDLHGRHEASRLASGRRVPAFHPLAGHDSKGMLLPKNPYNGPLAGIHVQRLPVVDVLERPVRDLRISVTDRCNFRCRYCMPREHFGQDHVFLDRQHLLTFEEILVVVKAAMGAGVTKVRITGGEPLLRRDIATLISMIREEGPDLDIALTTNGALLAQHAQSLKAAGLNRVTVSLDAVNLQVFQAMADTDRFTPTDVLNGIAEARQAGLGVKVNAVVKRGVNDNEVLPLAKALEQHRVPLRFIEFMDVGSTNAWSMKEVVSGAELRQVLSNAYGPLEALPAKQAGEVSKRYVTAGGREFGFIESVTAPFCGGCTRLRLSADGALFTCLFASKGHDLKAMLRWGADVTAIREAMTGVWQQRSDRYSMDRTEETATEPKVEMSYIGG